MSSLLDLMQQDRPFRRVSVTQGGEWAGPCVFCGEGKDRMRCWPHEGDRGRWWCRRCGKKGDAIAYLREFRGLSFQEAAQQVGKSLDERPRRPQAQTSMEVLCRYLEEQGAAAQEEIFLCEWAARSIEKAQDRYTEAERMAWAVRYSLVSQWIAQLDAMAAQVVTAASRKEHHGTRRD